MFGRKVEQKLDLFRYRMSRWLTIAPKSKPGHVVASSRCAKIISLYLAASNKQQIYMERGPKNLPKIIKLLYYLITHRC